MDERIKQSVLDKGRAVEALRRERVREELTRGMGEVAGIHDPLPVVVLGCGDFRRGWPSEGER